jgi:hypothetical protein
MAGAVSAVNVRSDPSVAARGFEMPLLSMLPLLQVRSTAPTHDPM